MPLPEVVIPVVSPPPLTVMAPASIITAPLPAVISLCAASLVAVRVVPSKPTRCTVTIATVSISMPFVSVTNRLPAAPISALKRVTVVSR